MPFWPGSAAPTQVPQDGADVDQVTSALVDVKAGTGQLRHEAPDGLKRDGVVPCAVVPVHAHGHVRDAEVPLTGDGESLVGPALDALAQGFPAGQEVTVAARAVLPGPGPTVNFDCVGQDSRGAIARKAASQSRQVVPNGIPALVQGSGKPGVGPDQAASLLGGDRGRPGYDSKGPHPLGVGRGHGQAVGSAGTTGQDWDRVDVQVVQELRQVVRNRDKAPAWQTVRAPETGTVEHDDLDTSATRVGPAETGARGALKANDRRRGWLSPHPPGQLTAVPDVEAAVMEGHAVVVPAHAFATGGGI